MIGTCGLCDQEKELKNSHLIPRFVTNWIKKTSKTGFLRGVINPNRRVQDSAKHYFLCSCCEERFSKDEKEFAEHIFYPYVNQKFEDKIYDIWLRRFIISISWRVLSLDINSFEKKNPYLGKYARSAYSSWKEYLLGKGILGTYRTHLFFTGHENSFSQTNKSLNFYLDRFIDATIYYDMNQVHIYVKLPYIILFTTIYPTIINGCKNTEINESGSILLEQEIAFPGFYDFLLNKADLINKIRLSSSQIQKIGETLAKRSNHLIFNR